jgi:hypothetical protein
MYLHLGENTVVRDGDIIGIFDIENTSVSRITKDFLSHSGKNNRIYNVSYEMPKAFVVCSDKNKKQTVYVSQVSAATLTKRTKIQYDTL